MNQVYNPGCALLLYKPEYTEIIKDFLCSELNNDISLHTVCCKHEPKLPAGTKIINTCAGCDKRFSTLYEGITTVSLWEVLAKSNTFQFPNYNSQKITIQDACPIRTKNQIHDAIRTLLKKMNFEIVEVKANRTNSICCGDSFYPQLSINEVHKMMKKRADSLPCQEVCVYCVSCIKSMHIGGKKPRYILDLLFSQQTDIQTHDIIEWHETLQKFIDVN
jgi:Fe-S oxidoreductase